MIELTTNSKKTYIAGHRGLAGSAITRNFDKNNRTWIGQTHNQMDLTNLSAVQSYFYNERPDNVIVAAARVGGIKDNSDYPVDYLMTNLSIAKNIIETSFSNEVKKLLFLGSSCIYPRECPQPIKEEYLLTGPLEPTNQWYATAKITSIKMCQAYRKQYGCNYISAMPCNLYGVNDTYDVNRSHVIPGLITKFHKAKINKEPFVECWGTGKALREFLYVDDLAEAISLIMDSYDEAEPINIGSGEEIAIKDLVPLIVKTVGYDGEIKWNNSIGDGPPRKIMDSSKIRNLGWKPRICLEEGLKLSYTDFQLRYGTSL
jgi:GDP-L-fucose synthase